MAQFYNDFSQYALGNWPTEPNDWTAHWAGAGDTWAITDVGADRVWAMEKPAGATFRRAASWDGVGTSVDSEIFAEFDFINDRPIALPALRASGTTEGERTGYIILVRQNLNEVQLRRAVSGGETSLAAGAFTLDYGTKYQIRYRVTGESVIEVYLWASTGSEPGTPLISYTDTSGSKITAAGRLQLGEVSLGDVAGNRSTTRWYRVGFGTDGDPAPTAPLVTRRFNPLLLR